MRRAVCDRCGQSQPANWAAGDLCIACGGSVRAEVRCAWCTAWTPAVKYCRACGCEVIEHQHYGAGRMLKRMGVDLLSISGRLRALDPDQVENLGRIYNAQLALVRRRVDEIRLCETCLLQQGFSPRFEEEWDARLPVDQETLAALASGPEGPFEHRPDLLPDIARTSPIRTTRTLASIALLRTGSVDREIFNEVRKALDGRDAEIALEAALALAHWRVRLYPEPLSISRNRLEEVALTVSRSSPLAPWAAAAITLARHGEFRALPETSEEEDAQALHQALEGRLSSCNPDLRFTCAIALGDCALLAAALESTDPAQQEVAQVALAYKQSPAIAPFLTGGPDEVRKRVLAPLSWPLSDALVEPVLIAVERGGKQVRHMGHQLLMSKLTEPVVQRLVQLGVRETEDEIFASLLSAKELPASRIVMRAVIELGWFDRFTGILWNCPERLDFGDELVLRLAGEPDPARLRSLLTLAGRQADTLQQNGGDAGTLGRFLARIAFEDGDAEIRAIAFRLLEQHDGRLWNWMTSASSGSLFGDRKGYIGAMVRALRDDALSSARYTVLEALEARWDEVVLDLNDPALLGELLQALDDGKWSGSMARVAAGILVKALLSFPDSATPRVAGTIFACGRCPVCRCLPGALLADYDGLAARFAGRPDLAEQLASSLFKMISGDPHQGFVPAFELLTRLARTHANVRERIGIRWQWGDPENVDAEIREAKERLDEVTGVDIAGAAPPPETLPPDPASAPDLDHALILPGTVFPTLADYVAALKSFTAAADPIAELARRGLTLESYMDSISRWGEVLGSRDDVAARYAFLMSQEHAHAPSSV